MVGSKIDWRDLEFKMLIPLSEFFYLTEDNK